MRFASGNNFMAGTPTVVKNLVIINAIAMLVQYTGLGDFGGLAMYQRFGMFGLDSPFFEPYQVITHLFMHGNIIHLVMNMFGLYMLGAPLEYRWGSKRFLSYYMVAGLGAAAIWLAVNHFQYAQAVESLDLSDAEVRMRARELLYTPVVGASGAVFGVLLAFGMFYPTVELMIFPLPVPIKARNFVLIYGGIELLWTFANVPGDRVAHVAHLGGMLFGWLLIKYWRREQPLF